MKSKHKQDHDEGLEYLLHRPQVIGITQPVLWSAKQIVLYKNFPDRLTDIDLMYRTPEELWVAEYKTTTGYMSKAMKQLEIASAFVKEHFNTKPNCLYVVGSDYETTNLGKI